jgi:hypothetical protein
VPQGRSGIPWAPPTDVTETHATYGRSEDGYRILLPHRLSKDHVNALGTWCLSGDTRHRLVVEADVHPRTGLINSRWMHVPSMSTSSIAVAKN